MKSLEEIVGGRWIWRRRAWLSRTYDLLDPDARDEPYATLRWREGFFVGRSRAELVTPRGTWRFVPEGALGRVVRLIREDGGEAGVFRSSWRRGGRLVLGEGRTLLWHRTSWLARSWVLEDENGVEWARFALRAFSFPGITDLELSESIPPELRAVLAGFGFYLVRRARAAAHRAA